MKIIRCAGAQGWTTGWGARKDQREGKKEGGREMKEDQERRVEWESHRKKEMKHSGLLKQNGVPSSNYPIHRTPDPGARGYATTARDGTGAVPSTHMIRCAPRRISHSPTGRGGLYARGFNNANSRRGWRGARTAEFTAENGGVKGWDRGRET